MSNKRSVTSIHRYTKRELNKKRLAFMSNISKLAAMKLTESGTPTTSTTGYAEIARRIKALRPDLTGGVKDVMAAFVGQGVEAEALQAKVTAAKKEKAIKRASYRVFYDSDEWRRVRYEALRLHGGKCCLCGVTAHQGAELHVDHIKPRSLFPELELDVNNLQVLCRDCNLGKSNLDDTDWRDKERLEREEALDIVHPTRGKKLCEIVAGERWVDGQPSELVMGDGSSRPMTEQEKAERRFNQSTETMPLWQLRQLSWQLSWQLRGENKVLKSQLDTFESLARSYEDKYRQADRELFQLKRGVN